MATFDAETLERIVVKLTVDLDLVDERLRLVHEIASKLQIGPARLALLYALHGNEEARERAHKWDGVTDP